MTRRLLAALAFALSVATPAWPAGLSEADKAALRDMTKRYVSTALAADWDGWANLLTSDAAFLPPNGPALEGRPAIRTWVIAFTGMATFTATPDEIDGSDRVAYARGTYAFTMKPTAKTQGSDTGKWLTIYQRQSDGSWRIRRNIWNSNNALPK